LGFRWRQKRDLELKEPAHDRRLFPQALTVRDAANWVHERIGARKRFAYGPTATAKAANARVGYLHAFENERGARNGIATSMKFYNTPYLYVVEEIGGSIRCVSRVDACDGQVEVDT